MQTQQWHEDRRQGIGGSDMPKILGLSPYGTPYSVYLEKIGGSEPKEETWQMARGNTIEPLLRQWYSEKTGRTIHLPNKAIAHPKYDYIRYNPDGLVLDEKILAEYKDVAFPFGWGEAGTDEVPMAYNVQVQVGMMVLGYDVAHVFPSISAQEPKIYIVQADQEIQEMILSAAAAFWDKVQNRIEPEPISNEDVAMRYKKVNGLSIPIDATTATNVIALREVRDTMKQLEGKKETLEVAIKHYIGENEVLVAEDGFTPLITWKQRKGSKRIDSDLLKKEQPDIAERYSKTGDSTRTFLVK